MNRPTASSCDTPGAHYDVRALTANGPMESLRPLWENLNEYPNAQVDFFRLINEARQTVVRPHVLVVERDGKPDGLAVGRVVQQQFNCCVGYKTFSLGEVRQLHIIQGGVLGCAGEASATALLTELLTMLKRRDVDLVFASHLDTASSFFRLAKSRPGILCRDKVIVAKSHWKTSLPATQGDFLQRLNKKHRYWLRRMDRLIERDFPNQVSVRSYTEATDLAELTAALECVAAKTYQRRLGAGYRNDKEHALRLAFAAARGWLRAYVLYLGNRPAAFWVGTLYKGVFHSETTGYDPQFRSHEVGTVLFMKMVERLCREGAKAIDFGLGDALYKRRFGDQQWQEASVLIYSPTWRGTSLNLAKTTIEAPALCLHSMLRIGNLQQRLKTLWRRHVLNRDTQ